MVLCNDCNHYSEVQYHQLGTKCLKCCSYNTRMVDRDECTEYYSGPNARTYVCDIPITNASTILPPSDSGNESSDQSENKNDK